jgi:hypothetical protein
VDEVVAGTAPTRCATNQGDLALKVRAAAGIRPKFENCRLLANDTRGKPECVATVGLTAAQTDSDIADDDVVSDMSYLSHRVLRSAASVIICKADRLNYAEIGK